MSKREKGVEFHRLEEEEALPELLSLPIFYLNKKYRK